MVRTRSASCGIAVVVRLYFSAAAEFFSLEEPLKPAGNEIFVRRQYFKLVNHPTLLKGFVSERVPLNDGETIKSGDRIEVVLTVEAKNNYEYLLFEDLKPAGLEAVQIRSGESLYVRELKSGGGFTGQQRWVYQELRDRKVALFIDKLPRRHLAAQLRDASGGAGSVPCAARSWAMRCTFRRSGPMVPRRACGLDKTDRFTNAMLVVNPVSWNPCHRSRPVALSPPGSSPAPSPDRQA